MCPDELKGQIRVIVWQAKKSEVCYKETYSKPVSDAPGGDKKFKSLSFRGNRAKYTPLQSIENLQTIENLQLIKKASLQSPKKTSLKLIKKTFLKLIKKIFPELIRKTLWCKKI